MRTLGTHDLVLARGDVGVVRWLADKIRSREFRWDTALPEVACVHQAYACGIRPELVCKRVVGWTVDIS